MTAGIRLDGWDPIPDALELGEAAVDLLVADLDELGDGAGRALSAVERERAERLVSPRDALRWMAARGSLRAVLGRYLGRDPAAIELVTAHRGKPALGGSDAGRLRFSLSRSDRFALIAVAADREVGIDIEARDRPVRELAIARRAFPDARARLSALEEPDLRREFLRLWVRHEAQVKCLGSGLSRPPSAAERRALWTAEIELGPVIFAAVAADGGPPRELRRWTISR